MLENSSRICFLTSYLDEKKKCLFEPFSLDLTNSPGILETDLQHLLEFLDNQKVSKLTISLSDVHNYPEILKRFKNVDHIYIYFNIKNVSDAQLMFLREYGHKIECNIEMIFQYKRDQYSDFVIPFTKSLYIMFHSIKNTYDLKHLRKLSISSINNDRISLNDIFSNCICLKQFELLCHSTSICVWDTILQSLADIGNLPNIETLKLLSFYINGAQPLQFLDVLKRFPNLTSISYNDQSFLFYPFDWLNLVLTNFPNLKKVRHEQRLCLLRPKVAISSLNNLEHLDLRNHVFEDVISICKSCTNLRVLKWFNKDDTYSTKPDFLQTLNGISHVLGNLKNISVSFCHEKLFCMLQRCKKIYVFNPPNFNLNDENYYIHSFSGDFKSYGGNFWCPNEQSLQILKRNRRQHKYLVKICILFLCASRFSDYKRLYLPKSVMSILSKIIWSKKYESDWL